MLLELNLELFAERWVKQIAAGKLDQLGTVESQKMDSVGNARNVGLDAGNIQLDSADALQMLVAGGV